MAPHAWSRRSFLRAALLGASMPLGRPTGAAASSALSAPGRLALYNIHTREALEVTYRDAAGRYDPGALRALDHLLRCHHTGLETSMDVAVIEFLAEVGRRLGGGHEIHVVSGFRSRQYNDWLIRCGHGVARSSLHLVGRAVDVRFPGVPLADVRRTALELALGGVGYYPQPGFVHLDSGRVRSW